MIRAGMGLILGMVFLALLQVNNLRENNAVAGTMEGERIVFNSHKMTGSSINQGNNNDYYGPGRFELYSDENDTIKQSVCTAGNLSESQSEEIKQLKLIQFFSMLKSNK